MKIGGGMDSNYFFEERWNNIESKGESEIVNIEVYLFILLQNITLLFFCWFVYARKCVVASMVATPMVGG
jgi:hypothetical protein